MFLFEGDKGCVSLPAYLGFTEAVCGAPVSNRLSNTESLSGINLLVEKMGLPSNPHKLIAHSAIID